MMASRPLLACTAWLIAAVSLAAGCPASAHSPPERDSDELTTLRVETIPVGARVYLDDRDTAPVGETPETLTVDPGTYEVFVEKTGFAPRRATVSVDEGQEQVVQFELDEADTRGDDFRLLDTTDVEWWKPVGTVGLVGIGGLATYQFARGGDEHRGTWGLIAGAGWLAAIGFTTWWAVDHHNRQMGLGAAPTDGGMSLGVFGRF